MKLLIINLSDIKQELKKNSVLKKIENKHTTTNVHKPPKWGTSCPINKIHFFSNKLRVGLGGGKFKVNGWS